MAAASPASEQSVPSPAGLWGRRSITGAAVVLAVSLFFIAGIPALNDLVEGENPFQPGEPYVVADSYRITPVEGWELDLSNDLFTALRKSGAVLVLTIAVEASQTPDEVMGATVDALDAESGTTWIYGDTRTFETDAGDQGLELTAHSTESVQMNWVVSDGEMNIIALGRSPDVVWVSVAEELDEMVRSIEFGTGADTP